MTYPNLIMYHEGLKVQYHYTKWIKTITSVLALDCILFVLCISASELMKYGNIEHQPPSLHGRQRKETGNSNIITSMDDNLICIKIILSKKFSFVETHLKK